MEISPITIKYLDQYYYKKARSSFKTRFDLLLYERITHSNYAEISPKELDEFEIIDHSISMGECINIYWQQEDIKKFEIQGKPIEKIYQEIRDWRVIHKTNIDNLLKYYIENIFPRVFSKDDFYYLVENAKECDYCHITLDQINKLIDKKELFKKHITRGWSLEIDRKSANLEYTKDNCVTCCYWCNNAKTDEFSHGEFKKIGLEIQKIWNERLENK